MKSPNFMRIVLGGTILAVGFFLYEYVSLKHTKQQENENTSQNSVAIVEVRRGRDYGQAHIGGHFELVDTRGKTRSDADFKGRYMLVYFGYSFCPDICPAALINLSQALSHMSAKERRNIAPIFITIDPERDSIEHMASYMTNYHQDIVALTGSRAQIQEAVKAYHVYAKKVSPEGTQANYLMDHSSIVYLMDRQGRYITSFNHETEPEQILKIVRSNLR